jgi:hypothetical protein
MLLQARRSHVRSFYTVLQGKEMILNLLAGSLSFRSQYPYFYDIRAFVVRNGLVRGSRINDLETCLVLLWQDLSVMPEERDHFIGLFALVMST